MTSTQNQAKTTVDPEALRAEVREKYSRVATDPTATFHFHTGRALAARLGIAGGQSVDDWCDLIAGAGFSEIAVGLATDTFAGAAGEQRARAYEVYAHTFRARKPPTP